MNKLLKYTEISQLNHDNIRFLQKIYLSPLLGMSKETLCELLTKLP